MSRGSYTSLWLRVATGVAVVLGTFVSASRMSVSGQGQAQPSKPSTQSAAAKPKKVPAVPRTADGKPDVTGAWNYSNLTPLERPKELGTKAFFTEEEAAAFEKRTLGTFDRRDGGSQADVERAYGELWRDRGTNVWNLRTSLIVEPPDGRIPPYTPEAQKRVAAREKWRAEHEFDSAQSRGLYERCLQGFNAGPPMAPSSYNNLVQLVLSRNHLAILNEMVHDIRVVPLDGRPHLPANMRLWMGDARGRWEGDTVVVETTNFREEGRLSGIASASFKGASPNMRLTERFTRVDADTLMYEFTVDDPETFAQPWRAIIPMRRSEEPLYEYACHEGNHAIIGVLEGARADEQEAAKKSGK